MRTLHGSRRIGWWVALVLCLAPCPTAAAPPDKVQIRYCGPHGNELAERDRKKRKLPRAPASLDDLCGRSAIVLHPAEGVSFPATDLQKVTVFKSVNHFAGMPDEVRKDETPAVPYVVVGSFELPRRWYDMTTIERYVSESVSKLGGHAVLQYDTYQDAAARWKDDVTGNFYDVFNMTIKGTVIRYTQSE